MEALAVIISFRGESLTCDTEDICASFDPFVGRALDGLTLMIGVMSGRVRVA